MMHVVVMSALSLRVVTQLAGASKAQGLFLFSGVGGSTLLGLSGSVLEFSVLITDRTSLLLNSTMVLGVSVRWA